MPDNKFSLINLAKTGLSITTLALGGFLVVNDNNCLYDFSNKKMLAGAGLAVCSISHLAFSANIITNKGFYNQCNVAGLTLLVIAPSIVFLSDYSKNNKLLFPSAPELDVKVSDWYQSMLSDTNPEDVREME